MRPTYFWEHVSKDYVREGASDTNNASVLNGVGSPVSGRAGL